MQGWGWGWRRLALLLTLHPGASVVLQGDLGQAGDWVSLAGVEAGGLWL